MKITREQAIAEHRKMWNWIADETEKRGENVETIEYFLNHDIKGTVFGYCFCCEYAVHKQYAIPIQSARTDTNRCHWCPINWGGSMQTSQCLHCSDYGDYRGILGLLARCQNPEEYAKLARQIANLPERTDNVPVSENT